MFVHIATPTHDWSCAVQYAVSMVQFTADLTAAGIGWSLSAVNGADISSNRNALVTGFLADRRATHLLFIDSDMSWRAADLVRLLGFGDRDVVAAICPYKTFDWTEIARLAREMPDLAPDMLPLLAATTGGKGRNLGDEPVAVDAIGTGIMLIARAVFDRLAAGHPEWRVVGGPTDGQTAFFRGGFQPDRGFVSEDLNFCRDVRAAGMQIWACPWLRVGHVGACEWVAEPSLASRVVESG